MSTGTPDGPDEALTARFAEAYGDAPDGRWAAPGRVNLIGEHTDYNDGFVLPFAIEAQTYLAARRRTDDVVRVASLQRPDEPVEVSLADVAPGLDHGWAAYLLGVLWAARRAALDVPGLDVLVDGRVPVGSGLSSSASLECAVALAVNDLAGLSLSGERLAAMAQEAENDYVGAPTGPMDQRASMLCTEGHALLLDTRTMGTEQVPLDAGSAGLALLVVDTGVQHEHAGGEYGDRRKACERACAELGVDALRDVPADGLDAALDRLSDDELRRRVRHVVTEDARTLSVVEALRAGDWPAVGRAMTASHASMREDYEITVEELDVTVETLLGAGALGARMTGGGFGGCAVALVPAGSVEAASVAVVSAFDARGWPEPTCFGTVPGPGARRL